MHDASRVIVVGAGLAGSEAAWQIAKQGIPVTLYEMRGSKSTPAHQTSNFAELVCSNSFRAAALTNAIGLLKEEMRMLDSVVLSVADVCSVPAGGALAVDREKFSHMVTERLTRHPLIEIRREEVDQIPDGIVVIATGPLTSESLSQHILKMTDENSFYFYDAAAPIVERASIDMNVVYLASRYDKGEPAYLNCPFTEEEFEAFYEALISAETTPIREFEKEVYFEGCMPIEIMAKRGKQTMLFGPMKPVGLPDPHTGRLPYAVVQLRQDNAAASLFNIVGFQTHLKWSEQKRVFRMIPGLAQAEFSRFGVMHRNSYINSPRLLTSTYQSVFREGLFFAGQMTGVEGYIESAASGLVAGINAARLARMVESVEFPRDTAIGSLAYYISHADPQNFQPMNITFGLFPPISEKFHGKRDKYEKLVNRSINTIQNFIENTHIFS